MSSESVSRVVERAAREGSGKLLASLLGQGVGLDAAEDAMLLALEAALRHWPTHGLPSSPEAWRLAVARRKAVDTRRREARLEPLSEDLPAGLDVTQMDEPTFPDERLRLFALCTHPAIDPAIQTPLMLQLVLGFSAEAIAEVYAVPAPQMSQRLVRAKRKIREAGIRPEVPSEKELPERLAAILQALYALYTQGWERPADPGQISLAEEALRLTRAVAGLVPDAEAQGLLALILLCEARRPARRDAAGAYVPLDQQDPSQWDVYKLSEGQAVLREAAKCRVLGRYQLEAAIQAAHIGRRLSGAPSPCEIAHLYDGLVAVAPSLGARVARAAAIADAEGPQRGLAELDAIVGAERLQSAWALRAHLLRGLGWPEVARAAAERAAQMADDAAVSALFLGW